MRHEIHMNFPSFPLHKFPMQFFFILTGHQYDTLVAITSGKKTQQPLTKATSDLS